MMMTLWITSIWYSLWYDSYSATEMVAVLWEACTRISLECINKDTIGSLIKWYNGGKSTTGSHIFHMYEARCIYPKRSELDPSKRSLIFFWFIKMYVLCRGPGVLNSLLTYLNMCEFCYISDQFTLLLVMSMLLIPFLRKPALEKICSQKGVHSKLKQSQTGTRAT